MTSEQYLVAASTLNTTLAENRSNLYDEWVSYDNLNVRFTREYDIVRDCYVRQVFIPCKRIHLGDKSNVDYIRLYSDNGKLLQERVDIETPSQVKECDNAWEYKMICLYDRKPVSKHYNGCSLDRKVNQACVSLGIRRTRRTKEEMLQAKARRARLKAERKNGVS